MAEKKRGESRGIHCSHLESRKKAYYLTSRGRLRGRVVKVLGESVETE